MCCFYLLLVWGKGSFRESALLVLRDVVRFVSLGIQNFDGVSCIWFCAFGKLVSQEVDYSFAL